MREGEEVEGEVWRGEGEEVGEEVVLAGTETQKMSLVEVEEGEEPEQVPRETEERV